MPGMTKGKLTEFLESRLRPVEAIFQKHIPKYFSEWDHLITSVAWLLRHNSSWNTPHKGVRLVIPYDFIPYQNNGLYKIGGGWGDAVPMGFEDKPLPSTQEAETIKALQRYFKTVLDNVASILNIRFSPRFGTLHNPSTGSNDPKLRLMFCKKSARAAGSAYLPGDHNGGDIRIYLNGKRSSKPKDLDAFQKTIVHEIGHALGLAHLHSNDVGDGWCSTRGHDVLSSPPKFQMGNIAKWWGKPIYHKYSNIADSVMGYDHYSNIMESGFEIDSHFGYLDYMALLCLYGPNPNKHHLKHIKKSYERDQLLKEEINLENYNNIKKSIPARIIKYEKVKSRNKNRSTFRINDESSFFGGKKHTLRLNGDKFSHAYKAKVDGTGQKVLLYTDMQTYVDGFKGHTQVSSNYIGRTKTYQFEVVFSPTTSISALRGSPRDDVVFFNKNIKYVSGRGGVDTYCFYKDKWGCHRIKEREKYGTPNYVIMCQPDLDHLRLYRWGNDLFIYDGRRFKEKNIRLINYFLSEAPNNMYRILAVSKERLFGVDNIPCFHNQVVNIASQYKVQRLRPRQHIAFTKSLQCRLYDRRFLYRLRRRLIRYGPEYLREVNSDYKKNPIRVNRKNPYGIVVRLHGVPNYIGGRILWYKQSKNNRDLFIIWQYKKRWCGFRVLDFFKSGATPLHLVDDNHKHLLTFKGMNGYGPVQAIDSNRIKFGWYKVHFP